MLKTPKVREGPEIFAPPPYRRGHDHNSFRRRFPANHLTDIAAIDMFVVATATFRRLWCKLSGSMQRNAREHYAAYAASTAFQISGAVLPLMRSFSSVN